MPLEPTTPKRQLEWISMPWRVSSWLCEYVGSEGLSKPFEYTLLFTTDQPLGDVQHYLALPMCFAIVEDSQCVRYFHGLISSITECPSLVGGQYNYRVVLKPQFWFLDQNIGSRIFKNKSTPQIIRELLQENSISHFDVSQLSCDYDVHDYCVQFEESIFHFISRLLEQAGIYYYFVHDAKSHTLILADSVQGYINNQKTAILANNAAHSQAHFYRWHKSIGFSPQKITRADYHYLTPDMSLLQRHAINTGIQVGINSQFEHYQYPGAYQTLEQGFKKVTELSQVERAKSIVISAEGTIKDCSPAERFQLNAQDNKAVQGEYVITHIQHYCCDTHHSNHTFGDAQSMYKNTVTCIPVDSVFRPQRQHNKPIIHGVQCAKVVGPDSEEIHEDRYARIKVQFPWNQQTHIHSCWLRVSQFWAGKNWGAIFTPRVGDKVGVSFLNGDLDYPVVIGSGYDAVHRPPYNALKQPCFSGIRTRSTPGVGRTDKKAYNELRFNDQSGQEELYWHAQRDWQQVVGRDANIKIIGLEQCEVQQGGRYMQVGGKFKLVSSTEITFRVGLSHITMRNGCITIAGEQIKLNCEL